MSHLSVSIPTLRELLARRGVHPDNNGKTYFDYLERMKNVISVTHAVNPRHSGRDMHTATGRITPVHHFQY